MSQNSTLQDSQDVVKAELSITWIEQNPTWFAQRYNDFFTQYSEGWNVSAKVMPGHITLVAERSRPKQEAVKQVATATPYDLLLNCPPDQKARTKSAFAALIAGKWQEAAEQLHQVAQEGDTEWHKLVAAKANEYAAMSALQMMSEEAQSVNNQPNKAMTERVNVDSMAHTIGALRTDKIRLIYFGEKPFDEAIQDIDHPDEQTRKIKMAYALSGHVNDLNRSPLSPEDRDRVRKSFGEMGGEYWTESL